MLQVRRSTGTRPARREVLVLIACALALAAGPAREARADDGASDLASIEAPDEPAEPLAPPGEEPAPVPDAPELQWGKGPFEVRDPYLLAQLRLAPYARSPRTLAPFELEAGCRAVWENTYGYVDDDNSASATHAHRATVDGETRDVDVVLRFGVLPRIELGAELTAAHWQGGSRLDAFIERFHHLMGLGTLRRDERPNDRYLVEGTEPDGRYASFPARGAGLGDGAITARVLALEGSGFWPALAITVREWLPTADGRFRHARGSATSIGVDASKRLFSLPVFVYAGGAFTFYDQSTVRGLRDTRFRGMGYVGLEWEIAPWISVVGHVWEESRRERALFRHTTAPFGNVIQYAAAGVKLRPLPGVTVDLGILENFHDPNTTGDFGFLFNVWIDLEGLRPYAPISSADW